MKWLLPASLILLSCLLGSCQVYKNRFSAPTAESGILDLSEYKLSDMGAVRLAGKWEFYWEQLLTPEDFKTDSPKLTGYIDVPSIWNGYEGNGKKISGRGYATYRLTVILGPDFRKTVADQSGEASHRVDEMALRVQFIQTAYQLYVNSELAGTGGQVGVDKNSSEPGYSPSIVDFRIDGDRVEIVAQVSNYFHQKGGMQSVMWFGEEDTIRKAKEKAGLVDVFMFGSILMMGIYLIGLFISRQQDRAPLYLGLFCVMVSIRVMVVGEYLLFDFLPNIPWEPLISIEYLTFSLPVLFFVLFIDKLLRDYFPWPQMKVIQAICIGYSLIIAITPTIVFSQLLLIFQFLVLLISISILFFVAKAAYHKNSEAVIVLIGSCFLAVAMINDALHVNQIIDTSHLIHVGVFLFILTQAYALSNRYSRAFNDLDNLRQSQETIISRRTRELADKNDQSRQLLHILCHDLQNPLANVDSIIDIIEEDADEIDNLTRLMRIAVKNGMDLITMVRELNALEEEKLTVRLEKLSVLDMVNESLTMLKRHITDKRLEVVIGIDADATVQAEKTSFVNSVLNNILTNAIKFSYPESKIEIETVFSERDSEKIVILIKDHGVGMPGRLLEDVFKPDKTTSRPGTNGETGTGFGMPLVRKFMQAYGGDVWIVSKPDENGESDPGTEVFLRLKK